MLSAKALKSIPSITHTKKKKRKGREGVREKEKLDKTLKVYPYLSACTKIKSKYIRGSGLAPEL